MTTEQTAQDVTDEAGIDEDAISSLAAALEAKDDDTGEGESDNEKTGEEDSETKKAGEEDSKTASEDKTGEEEKTAEDGKETGKEEGEEQGSSQSDELTEMRGLLRDQKRTISLLKAKQARVDKRTSKVIDEETGEEKDIEEELSPIETKVEIRDELSAQRGASLEIMLEQMSDTKKWGDVKEVVTENRVEELIDTISAHITKKEGGDLEENRLDVELSIWSLPNPYKYLHDLLKQYHPDFAEKEEKKDGEKTETKTDSAEKKPAKANASIGGLKGGEDKGGWTAAKIDAMDELDLNKVPKDVYDKYLRGELK